MSDGTANCIDHPPSSRRLPQVRMQGGVLALPSAHLLRLSSGDHLRGLCYHQVVLISTLLHPR